MMTGRSASATPEQRRSGASGRRALQGKLVYRPRNRESHVIAFAFEISASRTGDGQFEISVFDERGGAEYDRNVLIQTNGLIGVKHYPPIGFAPRGNAGLRALKGLRAAGYRQEAAVGSNRFTVARQGRIVSAEAHRAGFAAVTHREMLTRSMCSDTGPLH